MQKLFLIIASVSGAMAVMIGAFGAHALKNLLESNGRFETYETAVKYQFYHSLALLAVGLIMFQLNSKNFNYAGWAFILGIILFCGSLYLLCFTGITKFGAITPIGGLAFIAGWILLAMGIYRSL